MFLRVLFSAAVVGVLLLGVHLAVATGEKALDSEDLAKERMEAARRAYQFAWDEFKPFDLSKGDEEKVYRWSRRWMEAERDLASTKAERMAALQGHIDRMKKLEVEVSTINGSTIPFQHITATNFYRAEAENLRYSAMRFGSGGGSDRR